MTCPHCSALLRYRERSDRRCGRCGRQFVFEPRGHWARLTDARVRRAAAWLGSGGRFRYTVGQLGATVSRQRHIPHAFREDMLRRWPEAHGSLLEGLVDEHGALPAHPPKRAVTAYVLCPDRSVLVCLLANDVQLLLDVLVVEDLPPGNEPVLLLADRNHAWLAELRGSGRRAIAVGPSGDGTPLVRVRPSRLVEWLDLAVRAEAGFRDGARRAAAVDFLNWPGGGGPTA